MTARASRVRAPALFLIAVMLAAVAVNAPSHDAAAKSESRLTVHRVTIPAAHFIPAIDGMDYSNLGGELWMASDMPGAFTAPIPYTYDGTDYIFITRVELLVFDFDSAGEVCLEVWRAEPGDAGDSFMGSDCSGWVGTSGMDPQSIMIYPGTRRVNAGQRAYLNLFLSSGDLDFYAVRVTYTTNP